jgi:Transglycosylase-like domain
MRFRSVRILVAAVAMLVAGQLMIASAGAEKSSGGLSPFATGGSSAGGGTGDGQTTASASRYQRLWDRIPVVERRWAHRTAMCESGRDPDAIGGGGKYRGAFQFLLSSWKHAPKSPGGDPIDYSYRTQAVVAVALKRQLGTKPWPVCG